MATTIETDLKEVLTKIDSRLEHIKSGQADIKVSLARLEEKLDSVDKLVNGLESNQNRQIWVLIVAVIGAIVKFGFFPNP